MLVLRCPYLATSEFCVLLAVFTRETIAMFGATNTSPRLRGRCHFCGEFIDEVNRYYSDGGVSKPVHIDCVLKHNAPAVKAAHRQNSLLSGEVDLFAPFDEYAEVGKSHQRLNSILASRTDIAPLIEQPSHRNNLRNTERDNQIGGLPVPAPCGCALCGSTMNVQDSTVFVETTEGVRKAHAECSWLPQH
jgi:hypothetical protein